MLMLRGHLSYWLYRSATKQLYAVGYSAQLHSKRLFEHLVGRKKSLLVFFTYGSYKKMQTRVLNT